ILTPTAAPAWDQSPPRAAQEAQQPPPSIPPRPRQECRAATPVRAPTWRRGSPKTAVLPTPLATPLLIPPAKSSPLASRPGRKRGDGALPAPFGFRSHAYVGSPQTRAGYTGQSPREIAPVPPSQSRAC